MKRYIRATSEIDDLTISEYMGKIREIFYQKFPNSLCEVMFSIWGDKPNIFIRCYMASGRDEVAHKIMENDLLKVVVDIDFPEASIITKEDDLVPWYAELIFWDSTIKVQPKEEWAWCDYAQVPKMSTKGSPEEVLAAWGNYVETLYTTIKDLYASNQLHQETIEHYNMSNKL